MAEAKAKALTGAVTYRVEVWGSSRQGDSLVLIEDDVRIVRRILNELVEAEDRRGPTVMDVSMPGGPPLRLLTN